MINQNDLLELATDDQVSPETGPSISVGPIDKTGVEDDQVNGISSLKEGLKGHDKWSNKDEQMVVYGGVGGLNLLALGAISYWAHRRFAGGENIWKVIGIAAGAWAGISALECISMRYMPSFEVRLM